MKIIFTVLLITFLLQPVFSQDIEQCREIVKITTHGVNKKSSIQLESYLAPEFEIAGRKGEIAKIVLKQLFSQLGDSIQSYTELSSELIENSLVLVYTMEYSKMGHKKATFVFDDKNQLKSLELFEMEVKTMDNSNRYISKPKEDVIRIPFFKIGNLMAVEVMLNNEKRIFLFDSGSPKVILNSNYFLKSDSLKTKSISSSKGAGGSISGMDIKKLKKLEFGGITMENQDMLTLDISHLEKGLNTNIEIYGLIGYELIKDYDLLYDFERKELTLINPSYYNQYKNEHFLNSKLSILPFDLSSHIPVFKASIGNEEYSFGLDSGAEKNLMDDDLLASMSKHLKGTSIDTLSGADKNRIEVTKGLIEETKIGQTKIKNMETVFSDMSHLNDGYKLQLNGLMGYELLSTQKTLVSYHRKQMMFIE
ncbi:pepsin/retropepsin-like aspartic protease family protein [Psychroflexus tropicus]|uniref:pepsin/retropepsin-like aspartic protease family protein n=1 Tax=Psychroflexus tropicus TaxID=197345 RepID=UPI00036AB56F|nr:pepsin/retropepsin-like aspartic protease family protein [Psychroflexus tropicus]